MRGQRMNNAPMGPKVEALAECVVSALRMIERNEPVTVQTIAKKARVQVPFAQSVIESFECEREYFGETDIRGKILCALDEAQAVAA